MGAFFNNGEQYGGTATTASQVMYNTTESVADKLDEVDTKTGSDIAVASGETETIAEAIEGLSYEDGESGTLATGLWKYRKWADGTLEVWAHQEKSEPLDFVQWGNVYACDPSGIDGTSPVEFTSIDFATGSVLIRGVVGISSLKSDLSTYTFVRGPSVASGNYPTIKYKYQRGRWKA